MNLKDLIPRKDVKGGSDVIMNTGMRNGNRMLTSPLFIFLYGQAALLLVGVVLFSVAWGKLAQQFTEIQEWKKYTDNVVGIMKVQSDTNKYAIDALKTVNDNQSDRIHNVEQQTNKTEVIVEKISRIEEELKILNANQSRR